MHCPSNLADIMSIVMVFYDNNSDIHFLRIEEPSRCKIPRVSPQLCHLLVTLLLCMAYPTFQACIIPFLVSDRVELKPKGV